ncbi:MAG: DMT family transporter [Pseudorhodoplanes sp.]|uniref:DMT family transporter n=1 Tax=Pseudorhodoplanes sp. TaxID=1934341 RepID=UPI003D0C4C4C
MTSGPQSTESEQMRARLTGIGLMCGAVLCFACLDATAKYLNGYMDTLQVVWARYTGAFILTLLIFNPVSRPGLMRTTRPVLQLVRSAMLLGSTITNFLAFRYLQLDQALAILFSTPFMVAILAGPILGEWIGWRRWVAIMVGFAGVLLVTRPGIGGVHWAALYSVASAIFYSLYIVATRVLSRSDTTDTTLFYSNLVGAVAMLPVLPFVWTTPDDPFIIFLMVAFGAFGSFGHYLLIIAHRLAPASVLAPFMYTQLVWASGFGFFVFGDVPNHWTLAGAAIVVASGLYLLHRERVRGIA